MAISTARFAASNNARDAWRACLAAVAMLELQLHARRDHWHPEFRHIAPVQMQLAGGASDESFDLHLTRDGSEEVRDVVRIESLLTDHRYLAYGAVASS